MFRQRLLHYITQVVQECIPDDPAIVTGRRKQWFSPVSTPQSPDNPNFDDLTQQNLSNIVRYHQMHSGKHIPTCFKYRSKTFRFRFPRAIVPETYFYSDTEVLCVKRNHPPVNNYNMYTDFIDDSCQSWSLISVHKKPRGCCDSWCHEIYRKTRSRSTFEGHNRCCRA